MEVDQFLRSLQSCGADPTGNTDFSIQRAAWIDGEVAVIKRIAVGVDLDQLFHRAEHVRDPPKKGNLASQNL